LRPTRRARECDSKHRCLRRAHACVIAVTFARAYRCGVPPLRRYRRDRKEGCTMRKSPVLLLLAVAACGGARTDQNAGVSSVNPAAAVRAAGPAANQKGTGLILHSITGLTVPVIGALGQLGTVDIDQAVITNFAVIENTVGQIVGFQAD